MNVFLFVELSKKYQKGEGITNKDILHPSSEWTSSDDGIESKDDAGQKLDQLKNGQVFFPPKKSLNLWPESGESIIRVHDDMDETIDHGAT